MGTLLDSTLVDALLSSRVMVERPGGKRCLGALAWACSTTATWSSSTAGCRYGRAVQCEPPTGRVRVNPPGFQGRAMSPRCSRTPTCRATTGLACRSSVRVCMDVASNAACSELIVRLGLGFHPPWEAHWPSVGSSTRFLRASRSFTPGWSPAEEVLDGGWPSDLIRGRRAARRKGWLA
jgi:hypothetical protein